MQYSTTPLAAVGPPVLLVDDETEICLLIASALRKDGVPSVVTHSLSDARRCLANTQFGAVVLDIHLPDGLGYDLIPEIKARSANTAIIVISAVDTERETALGRGADAFVAKPFDRSAIQEALRRSGITG
ncbi:MAG: response regulator [Flavobacteriales bacterium]